MHCQFIKHNWVKNMHVNALSIKSNAHVPNKSHDEQKPKKKQQLYIYNFLNCESIVEGKETLDLPRLPSGGRRDSCFALILPQDKFLLLLSDSPDEYHQTSKNISQR
uniref:Uncharacterized protein n=1 Tax=Sinocyclocheilus anshuiensis TaxID=1608454 RepID=A0A671RPL0_9TELE